MRHFITVFLITFVLIGCQSTSSQTNPIRSDVILNYDNNPQIKAVIPEFITGPIVQKNDSTEGITKPRLIKKVAPGYPKEAYYKGIEGWVTLEGIVTREGSFVVLEITGANPRGVFEKAAIAAVSRWKYSPAKRNGEAINMWIRLTIDMSLPK